MKTIQKGFIYKTTDGGENWQLIAEPTALVRWIIIDPINPNIIYASTGIFDRFSIKPMGILKSYDGGATWEQVNDGLTSLAVGALAMNPSDHLTLLAGDRKSQLFYRGARRYLRGGVQDHRRRETLATGRPAAR